MFRYLIVLAVASVPSFAEVLFEGYSKVLMNEKPSGYIVQRYEFDKAKKKFSSISYLRLNPNAGDLNESLTAYCNDKFEPISYFYTSKSGTTVKTIDAKFNKTVLSLKISDGKTTKESKVKVDKGVFLSTFLGYLMLQNGYKAGKKFIYNAIAEEDGAVRNGEATIQKEDKLNNQPGFRIRNVFKGTEFLSFVTPRGEILATESPSQSIATELVKDPGAATKNQMVPNSTLVLLFGKVPEGKRNILSEGTAKAN